MVEMLDYYSDDFRLKSIVTSDLQDLDYSYDSVGNVRQMNESVAGSYWTYGYDDLDRLTSAVEKDTTTLNYSYSSIGNILQTWDGDDFMNYSYEAGPHAVN